MRKRKHRIPKRPNRRKPAATPRTARGGGIDKALMDQLIDVLWLPDDVDGVRHESRAEAARTLLEDMAPAPGIDAMLACQMVACHIAAMDCLYRAALSDATPEERDRARACAQKFLSLFARQTDTMGRHRAREARMEHLRQKARQERQETEKQEEALVPVEREWEYINPDGTVATEADIAEHRARAIADGSLVMTPPRDRESANGTG